MQKNQSYGVSNGISTQMRNRSLKEGCDNRNGPCDNRSPELFFITVSWARQESCTPSSSKACRKKLRRDRLNDKFVEPGSLLEPGRPPKNDNVAILVDAILMVTQLRGKAQKLKESNSNLQEKIKEV